MKSIIASLIAILLLTGAVLANGAFCKRSLSEIEKKLDLQSDPVSATYEAFDFFKSRLPFLSLSVADNLLHEIETGFDEALSAIEAGDEGELTKIISRLSLQISQIRRLSGFEISSIL